MFISIIDLEQSNKKSLEHNNVKRIANQLLCWFKYFSTCIYL